MFKIRTVTDLKAKPKSGEGEFEDGQARRRSTPCGGTSQDVVKTSGRKVRNPRWVSAKIQ